MNRDRDIPVTHFALVIPTSARQAMGEATFLSEADDSQHVRPITLDELKATARKLSGKEAARFDALLSLRGALESGDQLALDRALERMAKFYRLLEAETPKSGAPAAERQIGSFFASQIGLSPEESYKYIVGIRSGPRATANPHRLFSYQVAQAIQSPEETAQIVLWWMKGEFRPAIYCPNVTRALFIHTFFLAPVGGLGFRVCPYDGEQFFQDRPNQEYCCPAHREAHRVARFRDNKKRKVAQKGKDGKKGGTQKAR